jgi:SAM-dependent methyltransferase
VSIEYIDMKHVGPKSESVMKLYTPLVSYFENCTNVLDLGCGRGILIEMLAQKGISAIGCDSEPEMVNICKAKGILCIQDNVIHFLETTNQTFDGICCGHIIEHMPPDVFLNLIKLAYSRLKKGGKLLIVTPNPEDVRVITYYFWLDLTHIRPYPKLVIEEVLRHHGFDIKASHDSIYNSPKSMNFLKRIAAVCIKSVVKKIVGVDILYRGDTVVLADKPH